MGPPILNKLWDLGGELLVGKVKIVGCVCVQVGDFLTWII